MQPGESVELRYVNAPVFRPDGEMAFGLTLWGPPGVIDQAEVQRFADIVIEEAARCTAILAEMATAGTA